AGFSSSIASRTEVAVCSSPLSGEQRARVIAHVRRLAEDAKVAVRNLRKKARQRLGPEADDQVQELTGEPVGRSERLRDGKIRALEPSRGARVRVKRNPSVAGKERKRRPGEALTGPLRSFPATPRRA